MLLGFIKALPAWFPHRDAEMEQQLYRRSVSSSVPFCRLCAECFGTLRCVPHMLSSTHCRWLFEPRHNWNSGLSRGSHSPLLCSQLSAFIVSGTASERMFTYWDCVHSLFQRILLPACTGVRPARAGRYGRWPIRLPLKSRLQWPEPPGGRCRDGAGSRMLTSSFTSQIFVAVAQHAAVNGKRGEKIPLFSMDGTPAGFVHPVWSRWLQHKLRIIHSTPPSLWPAPLVSSFFRKNLVRHGWKARGSLWHLQNCHFNQDRQEKMKFKVDKAHCEQ